MPRKDSSAAIIAALQKTLADQSATLAALAAKVQELSTLPQVAPAALQAPAPARVTPPAPGGPPSAFMAFVNAQRGLRQEPLADDPEAPALDAAAEKLAAMHPIDRQAYLEGLREQGRINDLRKAREALGFTGETDDNLRELLGASE
jgi:aminoglycoside phosphotransferase (APT) family kinase protein